MGQLLDLLGKTFHRLTVIKRHPLNTVGNNARWVCLCSCGKEVNVVGSNLVNENTKSCGCQRIDSSRENGLGRKTHGMTKSPEYKAWQSMKDRCYNAECENFKNYGARGILVWADWITSFKTFYKDLGPRPSPEHSLDRIDVNGHYEPKNCRWATREEQSNNKRLNRFYIVEGVKLTVPQISRRYGIPVATLSSRLDRDNLTIEEALDRQASRHFFTHNGKTQRLSEWAKELGMSYSTLYSRIYKHNWSFEDAICIKDHRRK